ncbi:MAG TPA: alpha/beta hydrolase family protein [bacterium]|nr:alpha/beta hydrolase family protein [bacterium]HQL62369.1 alpha/beta hydrolase family protein [bacterium]
MRLSISFIRVFFNIFLVLSFLVCSFPTLAENYDPVRWITRYRFAEIPRGTATVVSAHASLPDFAVIPAATGIQLVRVSMVFPPGAFHSDLTVRIPSERGDISPDVRVLTFHPGTPKYVRRAILTFLYEFETRESVSFQPTLSVPGPDCVQTGEAIEPGEDGAIEISCGKSLLRVHGGKITGVSEDGSEWTAELLAPACSWPEQPVVETVERGRNYTWIRIFIPDPQWPRILEIRMDSLGSVAVIAHLQRMAEQDGFAPDYSWRISGLKTTCFRIDGRSLCSHEEIKHSFDTGKSVLVETTGPNIVFPQAHHLRRGAVTANMGPGANDILYTRCLETDKVPHQPYAWRRAAFVICGPGQAPWNALFEPPHRISINPDVYDSLYRFGSGADLAQWPLLEDLSRYHRDAVVRSMLEGDDFGNVTTFNDSGPPGVFGMNRLNHCPPVFHTYYRTGDERLRSTALHWCDNFYDLSVWWGEDEGFGGTRYVNAVLAGQDEHKEDKSFMWRTNFASNFCTKGYDSFFYAYEETGDPRMAVALQAQLKYADEAVHTDQGECRNIGDVLDSVRMARFTGEDHYLQKGLELFRELRTKLGSDHLFSQSGRPILPELPFINEDQIGLRNPFAKPYIIGYALAGLPALAEMCPQETHLRETIRAVADFLAESQDPLGAWRYPHPCSTLLLFSQGLEHSAQICNAAEYLEAQGEPIENLLNAVERQLRSRILIWRKTGHSFYSLNGWEFAAGIAKTNDDINTMYAKPEGRDSSRDYAEGEISIGTAPPEGLVYFNRVLDFYLRHRPAERLFHVPPQLKTILDRLVDRRIRLVPQESGAFLRVERSESPDVGFLLRAPEWTAFPKMGSGPEELGGMKIDWKTDPEAGTVFYHLDRPEATFSASFIPGLETVDCVYTVWPKPGAQIPERGALGPCLQLKNGVFGGDDLDWMARIHYLSRNEWVSLGTVAEGNNQNVLFLPGENFRKMAGPMTESEWHTIRQRLPDFPLIAAISRDGVWIAATAAEFCSSICSNADPSQRCIYSQGVFPLYRDNSSTLRVKIYLFRGDRNDLGRRYFQDVETWKRSCAHPVQGNPDYCRDGIVHDLPNFQDAQLSRLAFPLAFDPKRYQDFAEWRSQARKRYLDSLLPALPAAPFEPTVIARERRDGYEARKIALNISADSRIPAYLLVPDGDGPFPAVIALHDHGAHFSIGKEKVVRPFAEPKVRLNDAQEWVDKYYEGRYTGDELAKRGYVVFSMDALFWGDRGRREGVEYEAQQALAANLYQIGLSWAGTIIWDDIRSAEFVAGLPEVDPDRIAAVGLSMGSNRAWHLTAATDRVCMGAAICWMGTTEVLTQPGNNQTLGYSAFSMLHPGLRLTLDYPHVASIACPKPMLFFNGEQDGLFPIPGVEAAYKIMRAVWESQNAGDRLVTKVWPVPHLFNREMQEEVFAWFDRYLLKSSPSMSE